LASTPMRTSHTANRSLPGSVPSIATSGLYGTEYAVSTQRALLSCRFRPLWLKEECNYEK
jgi:hypothetical protein